MLEITPCEWILSLVLISCKIAGIGLRTEGGGGGVFSASFDFFANNNNFGSNKAEHSKLSDFS